MTNSLRSGGLDTDYAFQVVFDYGEHDATDPTPDEEPGQDWDTRPAPFSSFLPGSTSAATACASGC